MGTKFIGLVPNAKQGCGKERRGPNEKLVWRADNQPVTVPITALFGFKTGHLVSKQASQNEKVSWEMTS